MENKCTRKRGVHIDSLHEQIFSTNIIAYVLIPAPAPQDDYPIHPRSVTLSYYDFMCLTRLYFH